MCTDGQEKTTWNLNFEAFHTVHSCSQSLLFIPTKCTYYVKYIYLSPTTSYMFWCLLHHLQENHCVTCSKNVCFLQCCYKIHNIYCFFLIYNAVIMFKTICISSFFNLETLKMLVKILSCSTLLSVGSCYILCMLAIYVCTVSSCVWVRNGVEILRWQQEWGPFKISTPLQTQTQLDTMNTYILPTYIINSRSQQIVMCYN